ncbi:MAG: AAA family ATPase [Pseudomonadota bacterium]
MKEPNDKPDLRIVASSEAPDENARLAKLTPYKLALHYAELGYHVFPVNRAKDENGESVDKVDKAPKLSGNWKEHASQNRDKIKALFANTDRETTYVAAHMRDHLAIDLDTYKSGSDPILQTLLNERTRIHRTQNGGYHVIFSDPDNKWGNSATAFPGNIEVRGHKGYIILPDGQDYTVEKLTAPIATPPYVQKRLIFKDDADGNPSITDTAIDALVRASSNERGDMFRDMVRRVFYDQGDAGAWHDSVRDLDAIMAAQGFDRLTRFKFLETAAEELSVAADSEKRRRRFQNIREELGRLVLGSEAKIKQSPDGGLQVRNLTDAIADHRHLAYVVAGFIARGKLYSCTAPKGSNKTTLAMHLAVSVAGRFKFAAGMPVHNRARVLFLAGENPDDVMLRFKAIAWKLDLPPATLQNIDILERSIDISKDVGSLLELGERKDYGLVIIDTAQAYAPYGEDSNANTAMLEYARAIRKLTQLGNPAVFILAHPTKQQARSGKEFEPYGAGSFSNEIDGLCSLNASSKGVVLSRNAKWRGRHWDEVGFKFEVIENCPALKTRIKDEDGVTHIEQETAPMLVPLDDSTPLPGDSDSPLYAKLSENQRLVVDAVANLMARNRKPPIKDQIVEAVLPLWAGDAKDFTKRQSIARCIASLVKRKALKQRGEEYWSTANPGNAEGS